MAWRWENNVKKRFYEMGWESIDWIDQAGGRDKGRAFVNTVVTFWVPYMQEISWLAEELLASQYVCDPLSNPAAQVR